MSFQYIHNFRFSLKDNYGQIQMNDVDMSAISIENLNKKCKQSNSLVILLIIIIIFCF